MEISTSHTRLRLGRGPISLLVAPALFFAGESIWSNFATTFAEPVRANSVPERPDGSSRLAVIRNAPDFRLTDQAGSEISMADFRGKVVLVSFVFTTCNGSCPATTHRMGLVQRELKTRGVLDKSSVQLLSISLDPARDTPDVLRRYMELYDADPAHWSFLTGPIRDVEKTIDAWGMWVRPAANGQLDHPSRIFLVDAAGRIREIYNLGFMKPEWVASDVQLLLDESKH